MIDSPPNEFCLQSDKDHEVPSDTISSSLKMNDQFDSEKISILNGITKISSNSFFCIKFFYRV